MDRFAFTDLFAVTNLLLVIYSAAMPEDHIRITDINCNTLPRDIKLQFPSVQECDNGYYLQCTSSAVPVKRICPLEFWWNPYSRMKFDIIKKDCVPKENIDCGSSQLELWKNYKTPLIHGDKDHILDFDLVGVSTADPSMKCPVSVDCSKLSLGTTIPIPILDDCNNGYYCLCGTSGLTLEQCDYDSFFSLTHEKFDPDSLKCVNSKDFDCAKWIQGQTTPVPPVTLHTTNAPLTSVRTSPAITTSAPNTIDPTKECPVSVDCSNLSLGTTIPIPILDDCNNGYYCLCGTSGLTLEQCDFDSFFSLTHEKFDPDSLKCVNSKDFDCAKWIQGQTTPVPPFTLPTTNAPLTSVQTSPAITTNAPSTIDPTKECPVSVDCSNLSLGTTIPIPILDDCNNGYYCLCGTSGLTLEQCDFDSFFSLTHEKFDPDSLKCVNSKDFDCAKWIQGQTTPVPPVTLHTTNAPLTSVRTSPAITTSAPNTIDPTKECPVSVDCSNLSLGTTIPIPILDDCNNGYYCLCGTSGLTLEQCDFDSFFSLTHEKFDPDSLKCVNSKDFDCAKWIQGQTTPVPPFTLPTTNAPLTSVQTSPAITTNAPSTFDPTKGCPISVDCSIYPVGRKIPIPILFECNNGYYCECDDSGLTLQQCTFDSILSYTREKLDPYSLKCVKSKDLNCEAWIQGHTTPVSPVTGSLPTSLSPMPTSSPAVTTNAPSTFDPSKGCPIPVDCSIYPVGRKIPIPILFECINGYYCECDDSGLTLQQCTFDSILSYTREKLDPYSLKCVKSKDLNCEAWIQGHTTPVSPVTGSLPTSLSPMPTSSPAVTTNAPSTFDPSKGCPIPVDCSIYPVGRKIPIPILFECINGYYCECDDSGLTLQQCTFDSILSYTREKLDPYSLKCVKSKDLNCEAWIQGHTTPVSPVTGSLPTSLSPMPTSSPAVTTNAPSTFDPSKGCPIPVDCSIYPVGRKIPIPILFECNNGYYCECDDSGLTLQQCTFDSILSYTREKLDPYSLKCVKSKDLNCEAWIQGHTTPVSPVTGSLPTSLSPMPTSSPAVTTNAPSTFDPSKGCPIPVDCSIYPVGRKIPIPILFECNNGYYCECDDSGLTLQQCTFDSIFSFNYEKLDPYLLKCVKSEDFDCVGWIQGRTTPIIGPTTHMPLPTVTTNAPTTFNPSKGCPIQIDCSKIPVGQKIPIPILYECNEGFYCVCEKTGVALEQCSYNGWFSHARKKLDPYELKCVKSNDFDCAKWINDLPSTTNSPCASEGCTTPSSSSSSSSIPFTSSAATTASVSTSSGSPFVYSSTALTISTAHPEGSTTYTAATPDRPTPVPELSSARILSASFSLVLLIPSVVMIHVARILC